MPSLVGIFQFICPGISIRLFLPDVLSGELSCSYPGIIQYPTFKTVVVAVVVAVAVVASRGNCDLLKGPPIQLCAEQRPAAFAVSAFLGLPLEGFVTLRSQRIVPGNDRFHQAPVPGEGKGSFAQHFLVFTSSSGWR